MGKKVILDSLNGLIFGQKVGRFNRESILEGSGYTSKGFASRIAPWEHRKFEILRVALQVQQSAVRFTRYAFSSKLI